MDNQIKILFHVGDRDIEFSLPTFFNFLEYKAGYFKQVWKHLTNADPPENYKLILSKLFNEIYPDGFIPQKMTTDLFEKNLTPETTELFINLMLSFGYKPHELLHMDPYDLVFVILMYEAKHRYLDNLEKQAVLNN